MITPREYLSWSSMDLLERSPDKWVMYYIENVKMRPNSGQEFGRMMADGLEKGELTGDLGLDIVIEQMPKLETQEYELHALLKRGKKEPIKLFSRLDTAMEDLSAFDEYKSGQTPWTQTKVDGSGQITFYATAAYLKTGKLTKDIHLDYVPTEKVHGRIRVVGTIQRFRTQRSMTDILKMMVRMRRAWDQIEQICERELL